MTEIISIPLSKLDTDPKNVRKTYKAEGVESLAASILANGVVQNIVVRKASKGRYFVTAGGRRRAALLLLAERGQIAADYAVNAIVKTADEATELSLTENVQREEMHPADQYVAFQAMVNEGKAIADIAARFGVTEIIVRRRLALAKVSPVLLALFRDDEMTFEQLTAFTVCDDHERQEQVWESLDRWSRDVSRIKSALMTDEIAGTDKRITFIGGLDVYEQAGGAVRRDLFDAQGGGFALDVILVEKLVSEKLAAVAEPFLSQGWKFVETHMQRPDWIFGVPRVYPKQIELSPDEQSERLRLCAEHDELVELMDRDEGEESHSERIDAISARLDELDSMQEVFSDEDKAKSGVIVSLDYYGRADIAVGIRKPGDDEQTEQAETEDDDSGSEVSEKGEEVGPPKIVHSAVLVEDLTAQKTAALRVELANNPDVALVSVVHAMLLDLVYPGTYGRSRGMTALQIAVTHERLQGSMKRPDASRATEEWDRIAENFGYHLPGEPEDLWEHLLDKPQSELLGLLAYAAAHTLNAVETKHSFRKDACAHADQIGRTLKVEMTDWFETTAESYFSSLNRAGIQAAVAEVKGADFASRVASMKKAEAAAFAETAIKGSNWLPSLVRIAPDQKAENEQTEPRSEDEQPFPIAAE
ncbi:ParB/RepB/Spo0J family partition protein (plasmid) [Agrobacterium rosae]|uniref:ParB/RepB/Spo0J family partition protein n=1 Tax=Agrobacterium rosae TaxID=1972867 RepID=A0ABU4W447_9HYPH|nr:ParB/RepB/Spo0J family partition protein [Agrobacterium rosae]MDX8332054.1 ParB/RepB/Spo0J family partition protein [Agrobacterium rosae]